MVEAGRDLGQDARQAVGVAADQGAQAQAGGNRRQGAQQGPGVHAVALLGLGIPEQMVGRPQGIKTEPFGVGGQARNLVVRKSELGFDLNPKACHAPILSKCLSRCLSRYLSRCLRLCDCPAGPAAVEADGANCRRAQAGEKPASVQGPARLRCTPLLHMPSASAAAPRPRWS